MRSGDNLRREEIDYWGKVKRSHGSSNTGLWRNYCDRINHAIFDHWLAGGYPAGKLLKTDLHEEAAGMGLYHFLHDKSGFVAGIDIGFSPVRRSVSANPDLSGICADIRNIPLKDNTFDIIVSTSTLDHFHSEHEIYVGLKEIQRVLKPGGTLLLTLDNPLNPLVWMRNKLPFGILNRIGIVPYFVGATLRPPKIKAMLSQLDMKVLNSDVVMHSPRVLAVLFSGWIERSLKASAQDRFLKLLLSLEFLASWPTRYRTGYFLAFKAEKNFGD
jgi:SAM-dependent methyltransferase